MARYSAYVSNVIDGDTFDTSTNERIRLEGIDAPESNTTAGQRATEYLRGLIQNRNVTIDSKYKDTWNRTVAQVWRSTDNLNVNQAMLDSGHATPWKG